MSRGIDGETVSLLGDKGLVLVGGLTMLLAPRASSRAVSWSRRRGRQRVAARGPGDPGQTSPARNSAWASAATRLPRIVQWASRCL